jgi:methanogenic corrinoid protein MtbC1
MAGLVQGLASRRSTYDARGFGGAPGASFETSAGRRGDSPGQPSPARVAQALHSVISRTLEQEVVPRLLLARRGAGDGGAPPPADTNGGGPSPTHADAHELARLSLQRSAEPAIAFVEQIRGRGFSVESIFLGLLAPAAAHLGVLWEQDLADFTQVTCGLLGLQRVLNVMSLDFQSDAMTLATARDVLLTPLPGEQHGFGMKMVAEFFRRSGWQVQTGPFPAITDLLAAVRCHAYDVVGFSVSWMGHMDALGSCIRRVRRASCNRALGIMVGGALFIEHPELVSLVGADATSTDARQAPVQARALVDLLGGRV